MSKVVEGAHLLKPKTNVLYKKYNIDEGSGGIDVGM